MSSKRIEIALWAIEITVEGGFGTLTWDGASDTYPSKCIIYQLTPEAALTVNHEAHLRGLLTYFSAGFKYDEIKYTVYAGVDGVGIGGAQTLRFTDHGSGMHGLYTEENIPKILEKRDEAANSFRGKGAKLLARLDTMYYEGYISERQNHLRKELFLALHNINKENTENILELLLDVNEMKDEINEPLIGRGQRLIAVEHPLLKRYFEIKWEPLVPLLKGLTAAKDIDLLSEEY